MKPKHGDLVQMIFPFKKKMVNFEVNQFFLIFSGGVFLSMMNKHCIFIHPDVISHHYNKAKVSQVVMCFYTSNVSCCTKEREKMNSL